MAILATLSSVQGRILSASKELAREILPAVEHETVLLPESLVQADGSLDVYDDVLKLFRLTYQKKRPAIQCSGLVGYIPLNKNYALEVSTRVPVGNLERLVGVAAGYEPKVLHKYMRKFAHSDERPQALLDVLTDRLLDAIDHIWANGLLKTYLPVVKTGATPTGRLMPFKTEWLSGKTGRPTAVSSSYSRTIDFGPNRVLRHALEKLLARYVSFGGQRARVLRMKRVLTRFENVERATVSELSPRSISGFIKNLPPYHEHYAEALMLAQLVAFDAGLAIRGGGDAAILPSILVDMSAVFEIYLRRVLSNGLASDRRLEVLDGNRAGAGGAKLPLFSDVRAGAKNPPATPDIVVTLDGKAALVIDAKYKPAPDLPDRSDVNQVVTYGARYGTVPVMVLHAGRPNGRGSAEYCGSVGDFKVFNGMFDLSAISIHEEEAAFVEAVRAVL